MADEIMDVEARERLTRIETLNVEQNRRLDRLIELAETIARMQEREAARDARMDNFHARINAQSSRIDKLEQHRNWLSGVLAVLTAIILPVGGYLMASDHNLLSDVNMRVVDIEARLNLPRHPQ